MKKIIILFTVVIFFAFLTIPLVMMAFPKVIFFKINENRNLSEFPVNKILLTPPWAKQFSNWFNDHHFYRNPLISLAGSFYSYVFNYSEQVYLTENDYMYYRNVLDNQLFVNYKVYENQKMEKFFDFLREMKNILEKKNIKLVVVVCPQKYLLYPEFLPQNVPNINLHYFNDINNKLREMEGIIYIDALNTISDAKDHGLQVFHKTDFHWTDPAAYIVSQNILRAIASDKHTQVTILPPEIENLYNFIGGQSHFLPLFKPVSETTIGIKKNWDDKSIISTHLNTKPYEWVNENKQGELPPVAFLGNSFGDGFIRSGLTLHFSKFYKFDRNIPLSEAVSLVPDGVEYFIWQIIEVQLGGTP